MVPPRRCSCAPVRAGCRPTRWRDRGRRRGRCPPASQACRRTRTGARSERALPGRPIKPSKTPTVFVSTSPAEAIVLQRRPELRARVRRERTALGEQHRQRRVSSRKVRSGLLPRGGPVVLGAFLQRSLDVRDADTAVGFQADQRRHIRARGCWRRCPAPRKPWRPSCSPRSRKRRGSTRPACRRRRSPTSAHPVSVDRADIAAACRQHRQGHHQGRRSLLPVLPGRLVRVRERPGTLDRRDRGSDGRSTRFR